MVDVYRFPNILCHENGGGKQEKLQVRGMKV